jgi:putative Mg2+ transporter-C (MgtC) family protein
VQQLYVDIAVHLGAAWLAGSLIGLERSFHGRPAGFRTHALVCLSAALLMMVTTHQFDWLGTVPLETVRTDPARIAQGIMTGIGFLGAGVIFKEGLSIRGLTTAASIWMTAALGILYGVGLFYPAILATTATLGTLGVFRWVETRMPSQHFALHVLRFGHERAISEDVLRGIIAEHGFTIVNLSYRLEDEGRVFEYRMMIRTGDEPNFRALAEHWKATPDLIGFRISPTGD